MCSCRLSRATSSFSSLFSVCPLHIINRFFPAATFSAAHLFSHVPIIASSAQGNGKSDDSLQICAWRYNPDGSLNAGKRAGLDPIELQPQIGRLVWQHECTSDGLVLQMSMHWLLFPPSILKCKELWSLNFFSKSRAFCS